MADNATLDAPANAEDITALKDAIGYQSPQADTSASHEDIAALKDAVGYKKETKATSEDIAELRKAVAPKEGLQGYVSNLQEESRNPLQALAGLAAGAGKGIASIPDVVGNTIKGGIQTLNPEAYKYLTTTQTPFAPPNTPLMGGMNAIQQQYTGLNPAIPKAIAASPAMAGTGETIAPFAMPMYDMAAAGNAAVGMASKIPLIGRGVKSVDALLANAPIVQRMAHAGLGSAPVSGALAANQNIQQNNGHLNPAQLPAQTLLYMAGASAAQGIGEVAQEGLRKVFNLKQAKTPPKPQEPKIEPQQYIPGQAGTQLQQLVSGQVIGASTTVPVQIRKAILTHSKQMLNFVDPVEKALYMIGTKSISSKPVAAALKWLKANSAMSESEIIQAAENIKAGVKVMHENGPKTFELKIEKGQAQMSARQAGETAEREQINQAMDKREAELAKAAKKEADKAQKQAEKLKEQERKEHAKSLEKKYKDAEKAEDQAFKAMEASKASEDQSNFVKLQAEYRQFVKERRQYRKEYEQYEESLVAEEAKADETNRVSLKDIDFSLRANRLAFIRSKPTADWTGLPKSKVSSLRTIITKLGNLKVAENNARANYMAWQDMLREEMGINPRMIKELTQTKREQIRSQIPDLELTRNESSIEVAPEKGGELNPEQQAQLQRIKNYKATGKVSKEEFIANNLKVAQEEFKLAERKYDMERERHEDTLKEAIPEDAQIDHGGYNVYHNQGNLVAKAGKSAKTKAAYNLYAQATKEAKDSLEGILTHEAPDQFPHIKREIKAAQSIASKIGDKEAREKYRRVLKALGEEPFNDHLQISVLGPIPQLVSETAKLVGKVLPDKTTLQSIFLTVRNSDIYRQYAPQVDMYLKEQIALIQRASAGVHLPRTTAENEAYIKALRPSADEAEIEEGTGEFAALAENPTLRKFILQLRAYREEMREMLKDTQEFYFPDPEGGKPIAPPNTLFGRGRLFRVLQSDIEQLGGGSRGANNPFLQTAQKGLYASYTTLNAHIHTFHFWEGLFANTAQDPLVWLKIGNAKQQGWLDDCVKLFESKGALQTIGDENVANNPLAQTLKDWDQKIFGKMKARMAAILPPEQQQAFAQFLQGATVEQAKMRITRAAGLIKAADNLKMTPSQLAKEILEDAQGTNTTANVLKAHIDIADYMNQTLGAGVPGFRDLGILDHVPVLKWGAVFMTTRQNQAHLYNGFIGDSLEAMKAGDVAGAITGARKALTFSALSVMLNGVKGVPTELVMATTFMAPGLAKEIGGQLNNWAIVGNLMNSHPVHIQNSLIPMATGDGGFLAQAVSAAEALHLSGDDKVITDPEQKNNAFKKKLRAAAFFAAAAGMPTFLDGTIGSQALIGLAYATKQGLQKKKTEFTFSQGYFPTFVGKPLVGGEMLHMRKNVPTDVTEEVKQWLSGGETNKQLEDLLNASAEDGARMSLKAFAPKVYEKYLAKGKKLDASIAKQYKKDHGGKRISEIPARYHGHFSWIRKWNSTFGTPVHDAVEKILQRHIDAANTPVES